MSNCKYWETICYPESMPDDWFKRLEDLKIPSFVSPLHEFDIEKDGSLKKPHYHIILCWDGPTTPNNAWTTFKDFAKDGCIRPERVRSLVGSARYLCHIGFPDKYQYDVNNVVSLCRDDYLELINRQDDRVAILCEIFDFISHNNIITYLALIDYCRKNNDNWLRFLTSNSTVFYNVKQYIHDIKRYKHEKPI